MCSTPCSTDGRSATEAASTAEKPARTSGSVDLGAAQLGDAPDHRRVHRVAVVEAAGGTAEAGGEHLDLAAHLLQRGHVHQAVLEHRLVQHRHAVGLGEQHHQRLLPVGHEARVRVGVHRRRLQPAGRGRGDPLVGDVEMGAHPGQGGDRGHQPVLRAAVHADLAAGDQPGDQVGEGLEAVAGQPGGRGLELAHALDHDAPVRAELDLRPHPLQEQRELDDLRLGGRVAQHGLALGEDGGQQHGLGGADARVRQRDARAVQAASPWR